MVPQAVNDKIASPTMMIFTITSVQLPDPLIDPASGRPANLVLAIDRRLHRQSREDAFVEAVGELTKFLERKDVSSRPRSCAERTTRPVTPWASREGMPLLTR